MKIFKRRRSISSLDSGTSLDSREERRFSLPNPNHEILYFPGHAQNSINNEIANREISPSTSISDSIALSESDTLLYDKKQQLELQETYNDNFTLYLPFLLRQLRNARDEFIETDHDIDSDDQNTMIDDSNVSPYLILNKDASNFNLKRGFIIVQELLKHNTYLFANEQSFNLFKHLRLNKKKETRNLRIVYDANGSIRRLSASKRTKKGNDATLSNELVDTRSHIIPLEYKIKGLGLPIFKIHAPYLSSFRKNSPYLIFKKYREIPLRPSLQDSPNNENSDILTSYEAYVFCTVYVKHFYDIRRYILNFSPVGKKPFRIIIFQHNYKPFADFNYQDTRFRVLGTSLSCVYVTNYSPIMKLMIIDKDEPSLCDNIINKKTGFEILSIMKQKKRYPSNNSTEESDGPNNDITLSNPYPDPQSPLLADSASSLRISGKHAFISRSMPPFGLFKDSMAYDDDSVTFIPKKFSNAGRIEIYQDNSNLTEDVNSTLSIDLDSLVINCILLTLRESNIRNSVKTTLPQAVTFQDQ